eukprot:PhM_4_TR7624/c0_g1_i1/m.58947
MNGTQAARRASQAAAEMPATTKQRPSTAGVTSKERESIRQKIKQSENDNRSWQEQSAKELKRQKQDMDNLKTEIEKLKSDLNQLKAPTALVGSRGTQRTLSSDPRVAKSAKEYERLREKSERLLEDISEQKQANNEIRRQLEEHRSQVLQERRVRRNVNYTRDSHILTDKQVKVLENRLDMSLVQFNAVLKVNKELREQIDTLRREREVFDTIYQKLEGELQVKKKEMAFIIEVSNIAYEERDNAVYELNQLRTFAQEEMKSFEDTFKDLDQLLEEDRKMKDAVKTRIAEREKKDRELKAEQAKKKPQESKVEVNRASTDVHTIQTYEDAIAKITAATEIPDLTQLVEKFLHSEDDNFSLFNYVNELHNEVEKLEEQNQELRDDIDRITNGNEADQSRKVQLKELEEKLRGEDERGAKYEQLAGRCEGILREVVSIVDQMFTRLDCDESKIIEAQGIAELNTENILLYLAAIEVRTDEYLNSYFRQTSELASLPMARGPAVAFDSTPLEIDPKRLPNTGDDGDASDEEDRVLSHEEMLKRAREKLQQRHHHATTSKGKKKGTTKKAMIS